MQSAPPSTAPFSHCSRRILAVIARTCRCIGALQGCACVRSGQQPASHRQPPTVTVIHQNPSLAGPSTSTPQQISWFHLSRQLLTGAQRRLLASPSVVPHLGLDHTPTPHAECRDIHHYLTPSIIEKSLGSQRSMTNRSDGLSILESKSKTIWFESAVSKSRRSYGAMCSLRVTSAWKVCHDQMSDYAYNNVYSFEFQGTAHDIFTNYLRDRLVLEMGCYHVDLAYCNEYTKIFACDCSAECQWWVHANLIFLQKVQHCNDNNLILT